MAIINWACHGRCSNRNGCIYLNGIGQGNAAGACVSNHNIIGVWCYRTKQCSTLKSGAIDAVFVISAQWRGNGNTSCCSYARRLNGVDEGCGR